MIDLASLLAGALLAAAPEAPVTWGKALVFDPGRYARMVPGSAGEAPAYPPLSAAQAESVRRLVGALTTAPDGKFVRATGLADPIPVSKGDYPAPTGPGMQYSGAIPAETVRREMGRCAAQAPESLGADAETGLIYVMVRLDCPQAAQAEWRRPYAAIILRKDKVEKLTLNIGDLANMRIMPANG